MGISEDVTEIKKKLIEEEQAKAKKFRLPFGKKVGARQKKRNYVTLLKINENNQINFKKVQITDQTFMEDDIPRLAAAGYVLYWKKNPFVILPSWSVEPFSPMEHYKNSLINGTNTVGYSLLMATMKKEQITAKKQMSGLLKWGIGIIVLGIIVYAIFFSGGG
jgi:hypothetical protein